ncbi:MAG: O-antigen ligase family protein [Pirellulaceae bacterium]
MGIFVVIASRPVKALPGLAIVCFAGLLVRLQSRGAVVGCVFSMIAMWLQSFRRWTALLIAIPLLLLAAIYLRDSSLASRFAGSLPGGSTYDSVYSRLVLWRSAWEMSVDHWFLGVGPGNFPAVSQSYESNIDLYAAHSNILTLLAELGVPGLVLYLSLLATAIFTTWRVGQQSPLEWPSPECRAVVGAVVAHIAAGCFITRHDQALLFILIGVASSLTGKPRRTGEEPQDPKDVQGSTVAEAH